MRMIYILILSICLIGIRTAYADEMTEFKEQIKQQNEQIKQLTQTVQDLKNTVETQQKEINSLKETQNTTQISQAPIAQPPIQSQVSKPLLGGKFTPEIGAVADVVLKAGSPHDDTNGSNRLSLRELELVLGSNVDPYSRLDAVVSFDDEQKVSVEEAYLSRFGLPFETTARIGIVKPRIGKDLALHRDILDTVDEPLVIQRYFGDDGMSKAGVDFSKLLDIPSPFVHQLTFGVLEGGNGEGGTAFGPLKRLSTVYAHLKNYRDINDVTSIEVGNTIASGSNDGNKEFKSDVLGFDTTFIHHFNPIQNMRLQGEVFYIDRQKALGETGSNFWGGYGLFDYRFNLLWSAGFRFDYVDLINNLATNPKNRDIGYTSYLTFYQSEFSRWRLQFSHTDLATGKADNQVMVQGTFAIGDHKHKLQ